MMTHDKKLAFIHKMTKMGLDSIPHYDDGGLTVGGPNKTGTFLGLGGTDLQPGTTPGQMNAAYNQAQNTLNQSGIVAGQLEAQTPQAVQAQAALSDQLKEMTEGRGPNPALSQLNQATGANVQNQTAMMAGQRGAAANPALIARQAAQVGATTQQQAAGQSATQMAQQQIAAQQNLANLSANRIGQAGQAATAQNQAVQNEQGQLLGANANYNSASNTAVGQGNTLGTNIVGGIAKAIGGAAMAYKGGKLEKMADGGIMPANSSFVGQYLSTPAVEASSPVGEQANLSDAGSSMGKGVKSQVTKSQDSGALDQMSKEGMLAKGGKVNAIVSPGEVYLSPDKVKEVLKGANPMKVGHLVPGKAKVKNDSLKNDTVPAKLDDGGVVIPRHITTHKMAPERAAAFVHRVAAKKRLHK